MTAVPRPAQEAFEVVTTGLPFCAFKLIVGALLFRDGPVAAGVLLLALGVLDLGFNVVNLLTLLIRRRRVVSACTLSMVTQRLRFFASSPNDFVQDLGNAIDVLLSFCLVAAVVGLGKIGSLPDLHLQVWNLAVVLNVLGAGISRVSASVQKIA